MLSIHTAFYGANGKESACQCGRLRFDPWVGRNRRGGNDNPLQCSWLENSMDREAWWATVHGVEKSQTRLNNWTCKMWTRGADSVGRLIQGFGSEGMGPWGLHWVLLGGCNCCIPESWGTAGAATLLVGRRWASLCLEATWQEGALQDNALSS